MPPRSNWFTSPFVPEVKIDFTLSPVDCMTKIRKVIFNAPATIVFWSDGTKTVVKCQNRDVYSKEHGLAMCIVKKLYNNKGNYNNIFKKWIGDECDGK